MPQCFEMSFPHRQQMGLRPAFSSDKLVQKSLGQAEGETQLRKIISGVLRSAQHHLRTRVRAAKLRRLKIRWANAARLPAHSHHFAIGENFRAVVEVRIINLAHRPDRRAAVSQNLKESGFQEFQIIDAVNGHKKFPELSPVTAASLGCELSHIQALKSPTALRTLAIMICEDDLEFLSKPAEIETCIAEFLQNPSLDVLSISGRPRGGSIPISDNLRIVVGLVGRGAYLVKVSAVPPLVAEFSKGAKRLAKGRLSGKGDLMWRGLQQSKMFFASPTIDLAQQSAGFSDIEGKHLGPR